MDDYLTYQTPPRNHTVVKKTTCWTVARTCFLFSGLICVTHYTSALLLDHFLPNPFFFRIFNGWVYSIGLGIVSIPLALLFIACQFNVLQMTTSNESLHRWVPYLTAAAILSPVYIGLAWLSVSDIISTTSMYGRNALLPDNIAYHVHNGGIQLIIRSLFGLTFCLFTAGFVTTWWMRDNHACTR